MTLLQFLVIMFGPALVLAIVGFAALTAGRSTRA